MVLPLYKVLSLGVKVFSKPLIAYTKEMHISKNSASHPYLRKGFIYLGNSANRLEGWINRRLLQIPSRSAYKPLNDDLALEKGV